MSCREWKEIELGEVCEFQEGYVNPSQKVPEYFGNEIKWVRANDLNNGYVYDTSRKLSKKGFDSAGKSALLFEPDSIVISKSGTIGRLGIIKDYMCGNRATINVKTTKELAFFKYIFYYLLSNQAKIADMGVGSVQKNLYTSILELMPLSLPNLQEQKAIAATLSCLDDMIELNDRTNRVLEEMAQVIFKYWFVDFEFPNKDGQPYKSSGGAMVDSELGEIPAGWRVGKLEDIANITMGQSPSGSSYNEEKDGIVFYQGRTDFGKRYPTIRLYTTEPKRLATKGDILLSVRAPVGDINLASEDCCIGRGLASLRSRDNCTSYLLYQLLNLRDVFNVYNTEGTVFGSINKNTLNNVPVLIPLDNHIHAFQFLVKKIDELIEIYSIQIRILTSIRDTLLPKLMSGEIRVPVEEVG